MISQGLWIDPDIEVSFCSPFVSMGNCICAPSDTLEEDLRSADYIFRADDEHFVAPGIDELLDSEMLWSKAIYYDFRDTPDIDEHRLRNCCVYVKRSWPIGCLRKPREQTDSRLFPMDYGLLNEYFEELPSETKTLDIACLFPPNPGNGTRRYRMLEELIAARRRFGPSHIGNPTTSAHEGRRAILRSPEDNPWVSYLRTLKQSRIVFTARPDNWDGDSRTWEAFASGAMVFMDRSCIPDAYPFIHERDCFIFDAQCRESIRNAIEMAVHYLAHESERSEIARRGYRFALAHHKPQDRVNRILRYARDPMKNLASHLQPNPSTTGDGATDLIAEPRQLPRPGDGAAQPTTGDGATGDGAAGLTAEPRQLPQTRPGDGATQPTTGDGTTGDGAAGLTAEPRQFPRPGDRPANATEPTKNIRKRLHNESMHSRNNGR